MAAPSLIVESKISDAKLAANRANAQFSTGPKTEQGKRKVSRNRTTHGLTGQATLIPGEDPEAFRTLCIRLNLELAPATAVENALIDTIANAQWRAHRIAGWIGQLTEEALEGDPKQPSRLMKMFSKTGDATEALAKIYRLEASNNRRWQAALRELRLSKETRNKALTGQNPTALNDLAKMAARTRALCESQGMEINNSSSEASAKVDSNPTDPELPQTLTPPRPGFSGRPPAEVSMEQRSRQSFTNPFPRFPSHAMLRPSIVSYSFGKVKDYSCAHLPRLQLSCA
jgi:hypothetical protein